MPKTDRGEVLIAVDPFLLMCGICRGVIHEPHHLACACRKSFCASCIAPWYRKDSRCPSCNTPVPIGPIAECRNFGSLLDGIKRHCINSPECKEKKTSFVDMSQHETQRCKFRKIACTNEDCRELVRACELKNHVKSCPLARCGNFIIIRMGKVYGCPTVGTAVAMEKHLNFGECRYNNLECLTQLRQIINESDV